MVCCIRERGAEVETAFSMLATYSGDRVMVGHFGFNTGYRNRIDILGPGVTATIDRVFTPPADFRSSLEISQHNSSQSLKVAPADVFALFFQEVIQAIEENRYEAYANLMLSDARVLDQLQKTAS